jgi:hypothetical protein
MRGLALDLGGIAGWACDDPGGSVVPLAGIWDCTHEGQKLGPAFLRFEGQLIAAVRRFGPDYIAFEAAVMPIYGKTSMAANRKLLGLGGITELIGERLGVPVYDVHLGSARKHFVGNARATKSDIIHQCKLNGWPSFDPNACDAICVLAYARACFGQQQIMGQTLA